MQNTLKFRYSEENILQSFLPFLDSHNYCYCSFMFTTFQQIIRQKLIPSSVIRCFSLPNENAVKLEPFFIYVYLQMYTFEKFMSPKQSPNLEPSFKERNSNVDIYEVFKHCLEDLLWLVSDNDAGMLTASHINHLAVFLCEEKNFMSFNIAKAFPFWFSSESTPTHKQSSPQSKKSYSSRSASLNTIRDERMLDPELSVMVRNDDHCEDEYMNDIRNSIMDDEAEFITRQSENASRDNYHHVDPSQPVELNAIKNYILENLERGKLPYHLSIRNIYSNYVFYNQESATTDTYFEISDISDQSYICILQPHIQTICVKNCRDCTLVFGIVRNIIHVTNCHHVNIICITNAIKISYSSNCTFNLCCNNRPILFTSNSNLKFAPYNTTFESVTKQLQHSGIDPTINYFSEPFVVDLESIHQLQQQGHSMNSSSNNSSMIVDTSNSPLVSTTTSPTTVHMSCTSSPSSTIAWSSTSPSSSTFSTTSSPRSHSNNSSPLSFSPNSNQHQQHQQHHSSNSIMTSPPQPPLHVSLIQSSPPPSPNHYQTKSKTQQQLYCPSVFSILDPCEFHLHFIPFENYHNNNNSNSSSPLNNSSTKNTGTNSSSSGVLTISEILKRIPSPLPREYQFEIQNRTKSIANLFDHIKQVAQRVSQQYSRSQPSITHPSPTISSGIIQNKIMDFMNRKFREWLAQSGYDKEYKVFTNGQNVVIQQQRNAARKRSSSGFQMNDTSKSQE
nr:unnamed protein product [Naegleria fowleri]